jgi:hypothetical protein
VAIGQAALRVLPFSRASVLLPVLSVQSLSYHRRCIISTIDSIVRCDALILTRLRARQPRSLCGIPDRGQRIPSSLQRSVRFWGSASLPTNVARLMGYFR